MSQRLWLPFCGVNRASHDAFADLSECPRCYLRNPAYKRPIFETQPQEIIELFDDSPIPTPKKTNAVFTASNKHMTTQKA
ncbi:hypothetical protein GJ744_000417 [Endocarpon pusillum]|uniref:Uncharacterized protein n=1 Tax=Endocarpon pusillum TaxID=364733 RepID=A0A8H7E1E2_9EURO|nr:hypothetical protein GJ744_000417 [Endocarpon pusillum]